MGKSKIPHAKPLLMFDAKSMLSLHPHGETGMGFTIGQVGEGDSAKNYAVMADGAALPLFNDSTFYSINDLVNRFPVPEQTQAGHAAFESGYPSRSIAALGLQSLAISSHYVGGAHGQFPLLANVTLKVPTIFYRYTRSAVDHKYLSQSNELDQKTYLTSDMDIEHANTGFAAVGRYALPIPLPCTYVHQYELPVDTKLQVGTVAPLFGQAGGGVEVFLQAKTKAIKHGSFVLKPY